MPNRSGSLGRAILAASACLALTGCAAKAQTPSHRGLLFRSSGNPLQFVNLADTVTNVTGFNGGGQPELSPGTLPGDWGLYPIPNHSGINVIRFAGSATGGNAICSMKAYSTHLPIDSSTMLSYWIYPQQDNARFVGVELHCTDGTTLSCSGAVDLRGQAMDPSAGHGDESGVRTWSQIECNIGKWLAGKTVDEVSVLYHNPNGNGQYRGYLDDIVITDGPMVSPAEIVKSATSPTPAWVKNAVIYGVNIRQFSPVGNFDGVTAQLDRLHKLGATILWLLPINVVGQDKAFGSPYCVRDYYSINRGYGTPADLHRLVDGAHRRGMKVILDLALNHTSWDNPLIKKHPDWYRHTDGDLSNPGTISRTTSWSDVAQLDYSNPALRDYMIAMQKYWIKTFDFDGFRFDCAELLPTEFWNEDTRELRSIKPDIMFLAEGHRPETMTQAFNVDYSFNLYDPLYHVMQGNEPASLIGDTLSYEHSQFPMGTLHMRYAGDQDTENSISAFGRQGALAASVLTFTLDGVPLIYNGMEIGDSVSGNFITGPPIDWASGDQGITAFYAQLTAIRKAHPELMNGAVRWIDNSAPDHVVSYARSDGKETIVVVLNLSNKPVKASVSVVKGVTSRDITPYASTSADPPAPSTETPTSLSLAPFGYKVFVANKSIDHVVNLSNHN